MLHVRLYYVEESISWLPKTRGRVTSIMDTHVCSCRVQGMSSSSSSSTAAQQQEPRTPAVVVITTAPLPAFPYDLLPMFMSLAVVSLAT